MDVVSIGAAVAKVKSIPGSAAQRAEAAAEAAEAAVASIVIATEEETKTYLGIN